MAKEKDANEPVPMVSDEEREFDKAVHKALTGDGVFPKGHPNEGMTRQEAVDRANEERQNPSLAEGKKLSKAPQVHVGTVEGATGKKDAAASKK